MYKLLIADDEIEIRTGLTNYFPWEDIGFKVVAQAANGQEALDYIHEDPVDVVLCDIKMPVMTGLEFAEQIYKSNYKTKVILLSGFKEFEYAQQALKYGVKGYIIKPTKYNELLELFTNIKTSLDDHHTSSNEPIEYSYHNEKISYNERIIKNVKSYVRENFQIATLASASSHVYMSPNYLSKFFKENTGFNFSDYLLKIRMEKSKELLEDISLKIYEISETVGYRDPKNFTRAFKKFYGISPRSFREHGEIQ